MKNTNYTIRFFGENWDYYLKDDKHYYLLSIERPNERISKFVRADNNTELRELTELIRNDRLLLIEYLLRQKDKYLDNVLEDVRGLVKKYFEKELDKQEM